jgi:beta-galactosidase/beta-glucuronidase
MKKFSLIALVLATLGPLLSVGRTAESTSLPLGGQWRFQLDRADVGEQEGWFGRALPERIKLPGGLTEQGIGDAVTTNTAWIGGIVDKSWFTAPEYAAYREPGNVKVPFWLQPELYYAGAAWFQRDFTVPQDWAGQRVVLHLERPHWETRVWVNGTLIGTNNALATPHEYDLGQLAPGKHSLTLRVDNRMILDIGENSHSVSDHTQGNWNGVVGRIELRATPLVWIEEVQVYPNAAQKAARVSVKLGNQTGKPVKVKLGFGVNVVKRAPFDAAQLELDIPAGGGAGETTLSLGKNAPLWDEFNPTLHELKLTLTTDTGATHTQQTRFGLREIATPARS